MGGGLPNRCPQSSTYFVNRRDVFVSAAARWMKAIAQQLQWVYIVLYTSCFTVGMRTATWEAAYWCEEPLQYSVQIMVDCIQGKATTASKVPK